MTKESDISLNEGLIRKLADILDETGLTEIEYGQDNFKVRVAKPIANHLTQVKNPPQTDTVPLNERSKPSHIVKPLAHTVESGTITSPMVGIVYTSADPGTPPFVKLGDTVAKNDTVLLIEAMKVFNQIKAPKAGKVSQILIENGAPIEFGEPLMVIS